MPRAKKTRTEPRAEPPAEDRAEDLVNDDEPPAIEPYTVLSLARDATADQIKIAYRKAALKHHPDKVSESEKTVAHAKFQEIAFAYAVLSDPGRRERYDRTGSTAETLAGEDGEFSWAEYFREQFRDAISTDAIAKFTAEYQGSEEERGDLLEAYTEFEGDMDAIFETVMCSDVIKDGDRFHKLIDEAIKKGDVEKFAKYAKENKKTRAKRVAAAQAESREAEEYAKELGVHDKLFGKDKGKGAKGKKDPEADLLALIQNNQKKRAGFLDQLEAKYAPKAKAGAKGKGKKRPAVEEEEDIEMEEAPAPKKTKRTKKKFETEEEKVEEDMEMEEVPAPKKAKRTKKKTEVAEEEKVEDVEMEEAPAPKKGGRRTKKAPAAAAEPSEEAPRATRSRGKR